VTRGALHRAGGAPARLWARTLRCRLTVRYYAGGLYRKSDEIPVFVLASGLAFTLLLSTVPLVLIAVFVLGTVLDLGAVQQQMHLMVRTVVPYELHAEYLSGVLMRRVDELVQHRHVYGIAGGIGLLAVASGLFGTMRTILNEVFKVQRRRHMVVNRLRDAAMVLLVLCFLLVSVAVAPLMEAFMGTAEASRWLEPLRLGAAGGTLYTGLSSCLLFLASATLYALLPDERPGRNVPVVSALWATALWEVAALVFGYYIGQVANIRRVYGASALAAALAMWIYYASLVFVVAALLGQLYRERRAGPAAMAGPGAATHSGGGVCGARP
jgi:YihY family inner membrane protein